MLPFAALTFSSPDWLWPAAGAAALALAVLTWTYAFGPAGRGRWTCAALKAAGVALLTFCLLDPLWSSQRARPGANLFALLADNSQSLQVKDRGESRSRGQVLQDLLARPGAAWADPLDAAFEVRRFFFDTRLHATADFQDLTFEGRASALATALRSVAERFPARPLAGVLLFTDGNATDLPDLAELPASLPPVYPVVLGRAGAVRDLALGQVQVSQTAFEDAPVTIQAAALATDFAGEPVVAQLLDPRGHLVEEQVRRPRHPQETLHFRFPLRPEQPGLAFYQLRLATREEREASSPPESSREATLLNNARLLPVDRGSGPYRILYVAGRPNWEYKFLKRALAPDHQIELPALIRIAVREPRFEFLGRAGETGNPLFRGFGQQAREEVERYDQPVLTRLDTRDELELRAGFPRTPEELFSYDALILDDLEAAFFSADQAALVSRFVAERGGGLLMLGGAESFQEGGYHRTPIGDLLPVYLDRPPSAPPVGAVRLSLASEGWLQAWARLRDNEADERARLEQLPPFHVFHRVRDIKPGATLVALATDAAGHPHPALVTQRFGRGRTAAFLLGDVWRWGMRDAHARLDMEKAWRQLVRWLVADLPRRVELAVENQPAAGSGAVQLQVRVRHPAFLPQDDATVTLDIQPVLAPGSTSPPPALRLRAEPSLTEAGLYTATFLPRESGAYRALALALQPAGAEIGRAEAGWSTDLAAEEFRSLSPNLTLLEALARRTGGEMVSPAQLPAFVRTLPTRAAPVMETTLNPLWHTPWIFALALACFLAEWGLRRRQGWP